jgi:signal transduction histidine kinase
MAALMGLTLLVLIVQDVPLSNYLRQVETDRLVSSLEKDAFVLAGRSEQALRSGLPADATTITQLARTYRDSGGARVVIVDAKGVAVVTNDDDQSSVGASYLSRPEIASALSGGIESGTRFSQTLNVDLLYVTVPVLDGTTVVGAVRLTYPQQVVTDAVTSQLGVLGIVALTTVLLAGIVGFVFSRTITRRLTLLERTTEILAQGDLRGRADEKAGAPEIRALSRSFNSMAERLEAMVARQRTFAADASHQLRTPLTALRLRLEGARQLLDTDPVAAQERLASAEEETDRLLTIIEGLLLLSRTEAQGAEQVVVDVAQIAKERVVQWAALASELGVGIRYEGPDAAPALAVSTAVEQVIDNYVDNALTVSPAGREIIVRVTTGSGHTVVAVLDEGPGLGDDERARAFDRFWRGNASGHGSGLGLAIVAQLVRASGGEVRLDARPGGGLMAIAVFVAA